MWPQTALILILSTMLFGGPFSRVYHGRKFNTVEELKQSITTEWKKLLQRFIDNSINEWRRRLECVVKNNDGHIEQCNFA